MMEIREYPVTEGLKVKITVDKNPFQLKPEALFQMAARINKKRSFLFVSPVLGKHLPVNPSVSLLIGRALALVYSSQIDKYQSLIQEVLNDRARQSEFSFEAAALPQISLKRPVTIIGFCETATALGHAFFDSFASSARYIHTTREEIAGKQVLLAFEEEHSHATAHRVYGDDSQFFADDSEVILVDDEVTTGKTNLNIIRDILRAFPHKKQFTIVSILDWRNEANQQAFRDLEQELGIVIREVSLLKGQVEELGQPIGLTDESLLTESNSSSLLLQKPLQKKLPKFSMEQVFDSSKTEQPPYLKATGRFGLTSEQNQNEALAVIGQQLQAVRAGAGKCLVLGTGEFMYLPMKIASYMGSNVVFHTTTRSPILSRNEQGYPISQKRQFPSPEQPGATNYVYGVAEEKQYQDIFVFFERVVSREHLNELNRILGTVRGTKLYFVDLVSRSLYQSVIGSVLKR
ncbi:phosphoribosyltransferase family protein [Enterococcus sp. LJL128]|uniref:phosphoribosyltransferase family protein n=1 Tax=Enterococcus sp. LJL51 TaxID=3416656 RepID=UPI003CF5CC6C